MAILLASVTALAYGGADFSGGLASRRQPPAVVALVGGVTGLLVLLLAGLFVSGSGAVPADLAWGAVGGVLGSIGVVLLYLGLARGLMSIVSPVTAVCSAALPAVVGTLQGDRPTPMAIAGMVAGVAAIAIVSGSSDRSGEWTVTRSVVVAALSGLGFGAFFVMLAQTGDDAGLWPVVASRTAGLPIYIAVIVAGGAAAETRYVAPLALFAGLLDSGANVAYLLAVRQGLLSVVAVVASLYPVATVVLARVVTHEQISPGRWFGLGLAMGAVALVSVG